MDSAASLSINARFITQPLTGVQRYSFELLNALDEFLEPGQAVAYCPPGYEIKVIWKNIPPAKKNSSW